MGAPSSADVEPSSRTISLRPKIWLPRTMVVGQQTILTVDVEMVGTDWPYDGEEYEISCLAHNGPMFTCWARGVPHLLLHRGGGTYGPVRWLLTATEVGSAEVRISLINPNGVHITTLRLDLEITQAVDAAVAEAESVG